MGCSGWSEIQGTSGGISSTVVNLDCTQAKRVLRSLPDQLNQSLGMGPRLGYFKSYLGEGLLCGLRRN